jgi:hypothetical protein
VLSEKGREYCWKGGGRWFNESFIIWDIWSSDQSFWLLMQRSRFRFPALPDFLRNRGSRTGSTQPREGN